MRARTTAGFVGIVFTVVAAACGGSQEPPSGPPPPAPSAPAAPAASGAASAADGAAQMAAGAAAMAQGLEQISKGLAGVGKVDVVAFEKLGEAMPQVSGWRRSEVTGKSSTIPFPISQSEATYENGDARVKVEIIDTALNQMLVAPFSMYLVQSYSERSSDGYKKGTTVKGEPAFEEVSEGNKTGNITVVVGKRFIVTASGTQVPGIAPARTVIEQVDFGKLTAVR